MSCKSLCFRTVKHNWYVLFIWKRSPFWAEPLHIVHYREYPPPRTYLQKSYSTLSFFGVILDDVFANSSEVITTSSEDYFSWHFKEIPVLNVCRWTSSIYFQRTCGKHRTRSIQPSFLDYVLSEPIYRTANDRTSIKCRWNDGEMSVMYR